MVVFILICLIFGIIVGFFSSWSKNKTHENNQQIKSNSNKYEELEKLQKLKENGAITEAEFEIQKAKILK